MISCSCGKEYIYGFDEDIPNAKCPYCKTNTRRFCYLELGKNKILLEPGKCLYKVHLDKYSSEYNEVVCKVIQNKNNPMLWGIALNLDKDVIVIDKEENQKVISKNGVIPIVSNLKIIFNENSVAQIICK